MSPRLQRQNGLYVMNIMYYEKYNIQQVVEIEL